ncbi:MAG: septum formation protein Maf [Bacteroidales bacterium]|nr:septum formation protein Maf [Bacteroidales bacterium]MBN2755711.1 septum formation protein Maf [Bacteroidales bacterium]
MLNNLANKKILLASQSPRRHELLKGIDIEFDIIAAGGIDEIFPENIPINDVPIFLAKEKAKAFANFIQENTILITADTIVKCKNNILNKPKDRNDAINMLKKLSGKKHKVITGVCISSINKNKCFKATSKVYFNKLTDREIEYYIDKYKPFDKAGSYGIQEWIGFIAIKKIKGSFYNVMGLPIQKLYKELQKF